MSSSAPNGVPRARGGGAALAAAAAASAAAAERARAAEAEEQRLYDASEAARLPAALEAAAAARARNAADARAFVAASAAAAARAALVAAAISVCCALLGLFAAPLARGSVMIGGAEYSNEFVLSALALAGHLAAFGAFLRRSPPAAGLLGLFLSLALLCGANALLVATLLRGPPQARALVERMRETPALLARLIGEANREWHKVS
jgi:hypothetical protein